MKLLVAASAAMFVAMLGAAPAVASPGASSGADAPSPASPSGASDAPPFVGHAEWMHWGHLTSLRVYPTESGRTASRQAGTVAAADQAWAEVLALMPDADTVGMYAQFICHWHFAEIGQPGKTSWNLEPWRPVVDDVEMVVSACNPGGPEERL